MGLLDDARAEMGNRPGPVCKVQAAQAANPKLAGDIATCITDRSLSIAAVGRSFKKNAIDIGGSTIGRHRANDCTTCADAGIRW